MKIRKHIAAILSVAIMVSICGAFPVSAYAASTQPLTESFIDYDGKSISAPVKSTTSAVEAPKVDGYTFVSQSTETKYIYSPDHLTYIIGYPDGGVKVENHMTRAEAVTVFYRLYNGKYPSFIRRMSNDTFTDINNSAWFYKALETLFNVGVVDTSVNGLFRPDDYITRAEFAVLAAKFDSLNYLDEAKFSDVTLGYWAYSYINAAAEKGWIIGYPDGTFRPDNSITRAEVMTLVNRQFNRTVTLAQLPKNVNPYNDIVESHWAFCEAMEATIKHDTVSWHGGKYNNGVYNVVIEKFVDKNGKEIAKPVETKEKANYHPTAINGYTYLGYVTVITHVYTNGVPAPSITKTASTKTANVGDTVTYTITLANGSPATDEWRSVVVTDKMPEHMGLTHGSVYLNGSHAEYSYEDGVLTVPVGKIESGKSVKVTFDVVVLATAYGETITNKATGKGSNGEAVTDTDEGININQGRIRPYAVKSPDVATAVVGQTITYTVTVGNAAGATYPWENAVFTDEIPADLSFVYGSVQVNGTSAPTSYNMLTRTLKIRLGDIAPNEAVTITFAAFVNADAYGKTIYNTAILSGDNIEDKAAPDTGVTIKSGKAEPYAIKAANTKTANVGDTITYTVTVGNDRHATVAWKDVTMTDTLPSYLSFVHGSVQVGGKSAAYSFSGGKLSVELGDIAPNANVIVTFEAIVNSTAYNSIIRNIAVLMGANTQEPVEAPDEGVSVGKGVSEGTATKTANVATAQAGDVITYTITVKNSALATYPWENATITDTIPAFLTFVDGSVQVGGMSSNSYSFSGNTLKIFLGDIAPNGSVTATFRAKVNSDAQGQYIVNTALVSGDNHDTISAPDKGVEIESGNAMPNATKSANVRESVVGDNIVYTITATNNIKATSAWKDVVITDVIPEATTFVHGSVYVNGMSASYMYDNRVLSVRLGNIVAGETVTVKFQVRVTEQAQGKTIYNLAYVNGGNTEQIIVGDEGVTVPEEDFGGNPASVYGSKTSNKISVKTGDIITYTITAGNSSQNDFTWYDVQLFDIIDTALTKIVIDSVTIDGRKANTAERSYSNGTLVVKLGTVEIGQEVTVTFQVKVTSEAAGELISNAATLKGSNANGGTYNTSVRIKLETDVPSESNNENELSDIHNALFVGYADDGEWKPDRYLTRVQLAVIFYRSLVKPVLTSTKYIADVDASYWAYNEVQYAVSKNLFSLSGGNFYVDDYCTEADLGRFFTFVYGNSYGFTGTKNISRINAARAIVEYSSRHSEPITNGVSLISFPDIPTNYPYYWIVMEVSNGHNWYLDSNEQEYWDN